MQQKVYDKVWSMVLFTEILVDSKSLLDKLRSVGTTDSSTGRVDSCVVVWVVRGLIELLLGCNELAGIDLIERVVEKIFQNMTCWCI